MITFTCEHCGREIAAMTNQAGSTIACPQCDEPLQVPLDQRNPLESLADTLAEPELPGRRPRRLPAPAVPVPNRSAVAAFALGIACIVIPISGFIFQSLLCPALIMEVVCAVSGGILGLTGYQNALRIRRGKGLAVAGTILCFAPMLLTVIVFYLLRFR
ncbi:MAG: hypothetical protein ABFD92_20410 [Planctomycetaceae bacterium]|nr:hypothetical protein [Planctomycetaceae bacterium]